MTWARAFARQACSDFEAWDWLCGDNSLPQCHRLHALQMAMEKAAKAYLMARGADPMALQSSHAYIAKNIPAIVRLELASEGARPQWLMRAVQALTRRIELLHPQVDDGGVLPANCEYPWQNAAGDVVAPADHNF